MKDYDALHGVQTAFVAKPVTLALGLDRHNYPKPSAMRFHYPNIGSHSIAEKKIGKQRIRVTESMHDTNLDIDASVYGSHLRDFFAPNTTILQEKIQGDYMMSAHEELKHLNIDTDEFMKLSLKDLKQSKLHETLAVEKLLGQSDLHYGNIAFKKGFFNSFGVSRGFDHDRLFHFWSWSKREVDSCAYVETSPEKVGNRRAFRPTNWLSQRRGYRVRSVLYTSNMLLKTHGKEKHADLKDGRPIECDYNYAFENIEQLSQDNDGRDIMHLKIVALICTPDDFLTKTQQGTIGDKQQQQRLCASMVQHKDRMLDSLLTSERLRYSLSKQPELFYNHIQELISKNHQKYPPEHPLRFTEQHEAQAKATLQSLVATVQNPPSLRNPAELSWEQIQTTIAQQQAYDAYIHLAHINPPPRRAYVAWKEKVKRHIASKEELIHTLDEYLEIRKVVFQAKWSKLPNTFSENAIINEANNLQGFFRNKQTTFQSYQIANKILALHHLINYDTRSNTALTAIASAYIAAQRRLTDYRLTDSQKSTYRKLTTQLQPNLKLRVAELHKSIPYPSFLFTDLTINEIISIVKEKVQDVNQMLANKLLSSQWFEGVNFFVLPLEQKHELSRFYIQLPIDLKTQVQEQAPMLYEYATFYRNPFIKLSNIDHTEKMTEAVAYQLLAYIDGEKYGDLSALMKHFGPAAPLQQVERGTALDLPIYTTLKERTPKIIAEALLSKLTGSACLKALKHCNEDFMHWLEANRELIGNKLTTDLQFMIKLLHNLLKTTDHITMGGSSVKYHCSLPSLSLPSTAASILESIRDRNHKKSIIDIKQAIRNKASHLRPTGWFRNLFCCFNGRKAFVQETYNDILKLVGETVKPIPPKAKPFVFADHNSIESDEEYGYQSSVPATSLM